jgi:hypothetical protein
MAATANMGRTGDRRPMFVAGCRFLMVRGLAVRAFRTVGARQSFKFSLSLSLDPTDAEPSNRAPRPIPVE